MDDGRQWELDAACRGMAPAKRGEPDPFFPQAGGSDLYAKAAAICGGCPVKQECRAHQIRTGSEYGMWAGKMAKDNIENEGQ